LKLGKFQIGNFRYLTIIIPAYFFFLFTKLDFPFKKEEIKESLNYIENNVLEGDKIYIYYGAKDAFNYYQSTYYLVSDRKGIQQNATNWL
jgi:hypothetical protein